MLLIERFRYEGKIRSLRDFAVFAAYFDESGKGRDSPALVTVAGAMASLENWELFNSRWQQFLDLARNVRGFKTFHAKDKNPAQLILNYALPHVMRECNVQAYCVTLDSLEYLSAATPSQRSQLGHEYGFASFACISLVADRFRQELRDDASAGFYVERGGPGFGKTMQLLGETFANDKHRKAMGLGAFGPVDRRTDPPVHPADLVSHEIATNRAHSMVVEVLGNRLTILDVTPDDIRAVLDEYADIWGRVQRDQRRRRNAIKRQRKRTT